MSQNQGETTCTEHINKLSDLFFSHTQMQSRIGNQVWHVGWDLRGLLWKPYCLPMWAGGGGSWVKGNLATCQGERPVATGRAATRAEDSSRAWGAFCKIWGGRRPSRPWRGEERRGREREGEACLTKLIFCTDAPGRRTGWEQCSATLVRDRVLIGCRRK